MRWRCRRSLERDGDAVTIGAPVASGDHVRRRGCDFVEGEILLSAGRRLTARDVALAAAADHPTLAVRRKPRVAILSSGDELAAPGEARGAAQIVASNAFAIAGVVAAAGGEPLDLGAAPDDPAALADRLAEARRAKADVLTTIGGASVGDHDLDPQGARRRRHVARLLAHRHAAGQAADPRPPRRDERARPARQSDLGDRLRRSLPPPARPRAARRSARPAPTQASRRASRRPCRPTSERTAYLRATLATGADGETLATPIADQDSSLAKALARADALLVRAIGAPPAAAGEPCRIIRLAPLGA